MKIEKELSEIRQIYASADKSGKALMEKLYSKSVLGDITMRVTSFETACAELPPYEDDGIEPIDEIAYKKLKVITKALNEGWTPNWKDSSEKKWFPWFDFQCSRLVFYDVTYCYAYSGLGSRLCFRTEALAKYAATQFQNLYQQFLA